MDVFSDGSSTLPASTIVGASVISLAPTDLISQSALILLLLLSTSQPLTLGCDVVLGANLETVASILFRFSKKERHDLRRAFLF